MAHKRNPINFENLEGTWIKNQIEFGKVLATMVSEHQRDLVGSSISRDFPTIVVNLVNQLNLQMKLARGFGRRKEFKITTSLIIYSPKSTLGQTLHILPCLALVPIGRFG
jgi:adenylosuccinate lyase